jgi:quercetin dioxygenase-like cupin family protein
VAAVGLAAVVLTGCAQSGQLGHPEPEPVATVLAAPPPPAVQPPPTGPVLIGSGRIEERVNIRTTAPSEYSVETVILQPGESTGWHRHAGPELTVVRSGEITLLREDDCEPTRYSPGEAVFIPDGQPHLIRNDGRVPAELMVTGLFAPGAPAETPVPPAC